MVVRTAFPGMKLGKVGARGEGAEHREEPTWREAHERDQALESSCETVDRDGGAREAAPRMRRVQGDEGCNPAQKRRERWVRRSADEEGACDYAATAVAEERDPDAAETGVGGEWAGGKRRELRGADADRAAVLCVARGGEARSVERGTPTRHCGQWWIGIEPRDRQGRRAGPNTLVAIRQIAHRLVERDPAAGRKGRRHV